MLFRQFVDEDLGCASYLIGDETAGEALLVDPAYAIEQYLAEADRAGVRITRVLETHTHADHVSGHGRLALEHGGTVGRPDLAVEAHEGAEGLFHSLRRLLDLPDSYRVFPGHVAGSLCGSRM